MHSVIPDGCVLAGSFAITVIEQDATTYAGKKRKAPAEGNRALAPIPEGTVTQW